MKLYLDKNIAKGTPEELVEYQRLVENHKLEKDKEADKPTFQGVLGSMKIDKSSIESPPVKELDQQLKSLYSSFSDKFLKSDVEESPTTSTDEEETPPVELQVGDIVKVLKDEGGAVGEATVSGVLDKDTVHLAGYDSRGNYFDKWSHSPFNLEKLDKELPSFEVIQAKAYLDDKSIDQIVEEELSKHREEEESNQEPKYDIKRIEEIAEELGYTTPAYNPTPEQYFEIIDNGVFRTDINRGTILKSIFDNHESINNYITSDGVQQSCTYPEDDLKQVDAPEIKDRFEFADLVGVRLTTDTDFAEECRGHQFSITEEECLSNFEPTDTLTVSSDDGSDAISFENQDGDVQFALLKHVKEIARPTE